MTRRLSFSKAALFSLSIAAAAGAESQEPPQALRLPLKEGSVRFAVIGDTGTASRGQYEVGGQMAAFRKQVAFGFVIMLGDNIYGADSAQDYQTKFELPYKALLDGGVKFYASLGNHDSSSQRFYQYFHMGGQRFYTFKPKAGVRFFALDSNYMDKPQLDWIEKELAASGSEWKICYFHHPLYSSASKHGSSLDLRALLEPIFVQGGVDAVFSGHDHAYERIKPQQGIHYFVSGAGGSLRKGNLRPEEFSAAGYDQDFEFMLIEIDGQDMYFQTVTRTGQTVDSGVIHKERGVPADAAAAPLPPEPGAAVVSPVPVGPTPAPTTPDLSPAPAPVPTPTPTPSPKPAPKPKPTPKPTPTS